MDSCTIIFGSKLINGNKLWSINEKSETCYQYWVLVVGACPLKVRTRKCTWCIKN